MAVTSYATGANEAVKKWSRKLFREALRQTWLYRFMGTDDNSLIQLFDNDLKDAGDRVRVPLRTKLTGTGISGDDTLEGNEESLTTFTDDLLIDQLRHAVRTGGRMSEQRVLFDLREEARVALTDWWADRIDEWSFQQLCGETSQNSLLHTGFNALVAPSSNRIVRANGEASTESLSSNTVMTLSLIDRAVEFAKTQGAATVRPLKVGGIEYYVAFIHPFSTFDLRTSTTDGNWFAIQKAVLQADGAPSNPIFTGALGMYNNVILHESTRVSLNGADSEESKDVANNIMCGAQAALMAFSRKNSPTRVSWDEEPFDYGNQLGVSAGMISGVKKAVFNSEDHGVIVMECQANKHS